MSWDCVILCDFVQGPIVIKLVSEFEAVSEATATIWKLDPDVERYHNCSHPGGEANLLCTSSDYEITIQNGVYTKRIANYDGVLPNPPGAYVEPGAFNLLQFVCYHLSVRYC